jgi:hypothetical protein
MRIAALTPAITMLGIALRTRFVWRAKREAVASDVLGVKHHHWRCLAIRTASFDCDAKRREQHIDLCLILASHESELSEIENKHFCRVVETRFRARIQRRT